MKGGAFGVSHNPLTWCVRRRFKQAPRLNRHAPEGEAAQQGRGRRRAARMVFPGRRGGDRGAGGGFCLGADADGEGGACAGRRRGLLGGLLLPPAAGREGAGGVDVQGGEEGVEELVHLRRSQGRPRRWCRRRGCWLRADHGADWAETCVPPSPSVRGGRLFRSRRFVGGRGPRGAARGLVRLLPALGIRWWVWFDQLRGLGR